MFRPGESVLLRLCLCGTKYDQQCRFDKATHYLHNHRPASDLSCTAESMESLNTAGHYRSLGHSTGIDGGLVDMLFIDILTIKQQYSAPIHGAGSRYFTRNIYKNDVTNFHPNFSCNADHSYILDVTGLGEDPVTDLSSCCMLFELW
jgi:hypothetical protein